MPPSMPKRDTNSLPFSISASQFLGAPLKLIDPEFYSAYMAYTKESFAVLITCLTQW